MKKNVLILCTGNSCRSQMAEVIWRELAGNEWSADSAGSAPTGYVHPLAIRALNEKGMNAEGLTSKSIESFGDRRFELVITVCGNAQQSCPSFPNADRTLHWPFDDPADAEGTDSEIFAEFTRVRDQIHAKIESFLADSKANQ